MFYDKLTFIYLTLPNFRKTEEELQTLQDKWFYLFRHLHRLQEQPQKLQERIFTSLFKHASIARFKPEERIAYESSLKYYRDLTNVIDTAWGDGEKVGLEKGRQEGRNEMVLNMLQAGLPDDQVMHIAQITADELAAIKAQQTHQAGSAC